MTGIIRFPIDAAQPERDAILENQGIPPGEAVSGAIEAVYVQALELLTEVAEPVAIVGEISARDFAVVYRGEGRNEPRTPVGDIYPRAVELALFAATIGARSSREIERRFQSGDAAVAAMLDSAASAAADKISLLTEHHFAEDLSRNGRATPDMGVLCYSPGYCGWHVSGQKKLFEYLRPEQIGITLRESFLMEPLKSVSGVLIAGPREIHDFRASYPFCSRCETRGCRERIRALLAE